MSKLDPANRTIFAATLTSQLGCVRRADQLRSQKLVHRQCQPNNFLGPTPGLMVLHLQLSNKGKHNKFGRSDIMGYISHIDALRDPSAQNGMMLLYRFFSLGEMLPPFDSCQMYAVPTYPAMRNCGCISDKQYGRNWKAAMKECNVDNWKITSITRLQGYHVAALPGTQRATSRIKQIQHKNSDTRPIGRSRRLCRAAVAILRFSSRSSFLDSQLTSLMLF